MRASLVAAGAFVFAAASFVAVSPDAGTVAPLTLSLTARAAASGPRVRVAARAGAARGRAATASSTGLRGKVAVQPIDGPTHTDMAAIRALVVRIVRGRGFRTMTSLPRYEGTAQYPGLARDHHLAAFVTADVEERRTWQRITFLVWNGATGSVLGRWSASGQSTALGRAVGRGFWAHLGPAMLKAEAPGGSRLDPAPTLRIDASDQEAANEAPSRAKDDGRDGLSIAQR